MCFHISEVKEAYEKRKITIQYDELYPKHWHVSGYEWPMLPGITIEDPNSAIRMQWGLLPSWAGDDFNRAYTLNARCETLNETQSFKPYVQNRCIVLIDGFFEWRNEGKEKYPFFIGLPNEQKFGVGGIFSDRLDRETGEIKRTFSIITTPANRDMEYIHNTKKRMPRILTGDAETAWLEDDLTKADMNQLMQPFCGELKYYTISRTISHRGADTNRPEILAPETYTSLGKAREVQGSLF